MSYEAIEYQVADSIGSIVLNRPEQLNAINGQMLREVRDAMARAADDDTVRVIVLTGAGRGFCAGADMQSLNATATGTGGGQVGGIPEQMHQLQQNAAEEFDTANTYFPTVPKPIIAAINGPAAGLGFVLMLFADVRIASDRAAFTTSFAKRGLIAEHGISWMLPRLVGIAHANDLLFTARKIDAFEAERIGLINRVVAHAELSSEVTSYARTLVDTVSPRSLKIIKEQLYSALFLGMQDAVSIANEEMAKSLKCDDFKEGVAHFLEKRAPKFTGS